MRLEYIPTVRGDMAFTVAAQATLPVTGGTTTSINATGTTWSTNTSVTGISIAGTGTNTFALTTTQSLNASSTSAKTLPSYITAQTTSQWFYRTTQTTELARTVWTTETSTTENENDPTFTFATSFETTELTTDQLYLTGEKTAASTVSTATVTANVIDTVYIAEGNEYIMALTGPMWASDWNGDWLNPEIHAISASRFTDQAVVEAVSVAVVSASQTGSYLTIPSSTRNFTFEELSDTGVTQTAILVSYNAFPNQTSSGESDTFERFEIVSSNQTLSTESALLLHYGNLSQKIEWANDVTTADFWTPENYRTYKAYASTVSKQTITTTSPRYIIADFAMSAGGNTSFIKSDQRLGLIRQVGAGNEPKCVVSKKYGAKINDEEGLYYTIDNTSTFAASNVYAAIDRANTWLFKQIVTLRGSSADDWTLSVNTDGALFEYTTTTEVEGQTVDTTAQEVVRVEGQTSYGIVATKSVLGGAPEPNATFYDLIQAGAYYNSGVWVTFPNSTQSYEHGDQRATSQLRTAWHIAYPALSHVVTIERNPSPF